MNNHNQQTQNPMLPISCEIIAISASTAIENLYRVRYPAVKDVSFGQFLQISLPQVGECPISITDFSVEEEWLEFLIRKVGIVTDQVFKLKVGDSLQMRGPYGKGFVLDNYLGKRVIIASGGSGLAPVRSLINYFYHHPESIQSLELLLGFKDAENVLFKSEVKAWRNKFPMILTVDKGCGLEGECVGLVTEYVPQLTLLQDDFNEVEVIIVGPPKMMEFTAKKFVEVGVPKDKIWVSFERRMSCAIGKCGHCRIDEVYVCLEGPVFNYTAAEMLLD